ncbi:MAG: hypothetical protein LPK45_02850, partial [Bacteroidota bacterium]|nr:hypothetical protein [Bacteroidota bacterium]MDX5429978.1 hypothetical protein [Bacteroidota bacterium]MDX5468751.1 hypothetical protein [Bacteroidota bacterium]
MRKFFLFLGVLCWSAGLLQAQNIAVGQWKAHLSQNDPIDLFIAGNRVYAWTNDGFARFDLQTRETRALSKIDGFSSMGVSYAAYHPSFQTVVIGYKNANIDLLLKDGNIYNVPDLNNASVNGSKEIYKISFHDQYAFFSCGFGILVYDLERLESSADYKSDVIRNVRSTEVFQNEIYAATTNGLFKAPLPTAGISVDASLWTKVADGSFRDMVQAEGALYLWNDSVVSKFDGIQITPLFTNKNFRKLKSFQNEVFLTTDSGVYLLTESPIAFESLEGSRSSIRYQEDWFYASLG